MGKIYSLNPNDYKLLEEVGFGASATVYRAIYLPSNEEVAVKCLDLDRCGSNLVYFGVIVCFLMWSLKPVDLIVVNIVLKRSRKTLDQLYARESNTKAKKVAQC
ncbi:UNVERIFIED_CONTAM: hypothetical protein Sradi_5745600 [Sesamum radiatum]|uniref:Protein kinase domain-containing protein n=1 Tax=Sesamum radiatum TaxID=300843 RepID=A0AAW2L625_SESRA